MTSLSSLNYRKLFLPAWTIPLQLTLAFGAGLYGVLVVIHAFQTCKGCTPISHADFETASRIAVLVASWACCSVFSAIKK